MIIVGAPQEAAPRRGPKGRLVLNLLLILAFCLTTFAAEAKFGLRRNTNMEFGVVASSVDGPGTAVINTGSDTKYVTGSITDFGGSVARAKFTVKDGTANGFLTITLPSSLTVSKSGVSLTVDNLVTDVGSPAQLDASGGLSFYVSGTLNVPTNQAEKSGLGGSLLVTVVDDTSSKTDDATATVAADVVAPIAISATTALSFGSIQPFSTSGTLTVSTSGATTPINVTEMAGGTVSEGVFTVTGEGGAAFSITLPSSTTLSSGANSMTVNNFQHDAGTTPTLAGGGSRDVSIGATLNVGPDQSNGTYTGTYNVTVNYN